ncbi:MAG TPA: DUF2341 domain-containing protein [Kofleriaceae bacterium]|jgi:hypothetical protein
MRWAVVASLGLAACYQPSVADGVPCALGVATSCPEGQTCVAMGNEAVCEPIGTGGNTDGGSSTSDGGGTLPVIPGWWNPAWTLRQPITVTAGSNGSPAGYAVAFSIDHASLVTAGQALASGDDVRVVGSDGTELDRVLDTGAQWDSAGTTIWFQVAAPLDATAAAQYWLYYGNPDAGTPPADSSAVFVLADGFEGDLSAWDLDTGVGPSTLQAHGGATSILIPAQDNTGNGITAMSINQTDTAFDAWWCIDDTSAINLFQIVRETDTISYFTNLQPPGGDGTMASTWDISKLVSGTYSELVAPPADQTVVPNDIWFRVTVYAYGKTMAVGINGTTYVPTSGYADIDHALTGTVGAGVYFSNGNVWVDDATVRPLVVPEPTVAVGPAQAGS